MTAPARTIADSIDTVADPAADGSIQGAGTSWVAGFPVAAPSNSAPNAPTVNSPANAATGIDTSPTLDVHVSDPDGDPLTVTFFGRPLASGNFAQIGQNTGVASGTDTTTSWANIGAGQTFEWYATVKDATHTAVTGPTWTFHTTASTDPVFVGAGDIADCGGPRTRPPAPSSPGSMATSGPQVTTSTRPGPP